MTTIHGGPERYPPDHQQPCEPWLFVLQDAAENYFVPEPKELGLNGSFAVFKMIMTDVVGFENFLQSNKDKIDPELLAAKMCGTLAQRRSAGVIAGHRQPAGRDCTDQLNNYEYVNADGSGDPKGVRCPVGAHMRRINPRGQPVTGQGQPGGSNNTHRLIRRGMPYGPNLRSEAALRRHRARAPRLLHQLQHREPIRVRAEPMGQRRRIRRLSAAASQIERSNDRHAGSRRKHFRDSAGEWRACRSRSPGFPAFVTTKAAAYCFLPSITAIKFISKL